MCVWVLEGIERFFFVYTSTKYIYRSGGDWCDAAVVARVNKCTAICFVRETILYPIEKNEKRYVRDGQIEREKECCTVCSSDEN